MSEKYIIYTDGGARGNPGPAAIGVVIYDDQHSKILKKVGMTIGNATNNQAEYQALIRALQEAQTIGGKSLVCHLDSELVVRQLNGQYKIKEPELQKLATEVLRLSNNFLRVEYRHVRREKNKLADQLVNKALDDAKG